MKSLQKIRDALYGVNAVPFLTRIQYMKIKKLLHAAAKSGELPGFTALCLFAAATGGAALLNDAGGGDPRFTVFAFCLCALGAVALLALIALIIDAVRKLNRKG